jgi:hypothetical protein
MVDNSPTSPPEICSREDCTCCCELSGLMQTEFLNFTKKLTTDFRKLHPFIGSLATKQSCDTNSSGEADVDKDRSREIRDERGRKSQRSRRSKGEER